MTDKDTTTTTVVTETIHDVPPPVIVDLGSRSKKAIKKLKNGQGKLMTEVALAIEQVRASLPDGDRNKQIVPVLIVYRKKGKRGVSGFSPLSALSPFNFLR